MQVNKISDGELDNRSLLLWRPIVRKLTLLINGITYVHFNNSNFFVFSGVGFEQVCIQKHPDCEFNGSDRHGDHVDLYGLISFLQN